MFTMNNEINAIEKFSQGFNLASCRVPWPSCRWCLLFVIPFPESRLHTNGFFPVLSRIPPPYKTLNITILIRKLKLFPGFCGTQSYDVPIDVSFEFWFYAK